MTARSSPWAAPTRHTGKLAVLACCLLLGLIAPARTSAAPLAPLAQRGVAYATWWSGEYATSSSDRSLAALASTGANWVSIVVTNYQDAVASTTIYADAQRTPSDADLVHAIAEAHRLGLKVLLKPHLDLAVEVEGGAWRGHIGNEFTGGEQWAAWFAAYRAFIGRYARLAQANGVDEFCVGVELLGTSQRAADWRQVVAWVRSLYGGPLVYAALHSGEEQSITWWDALDQIGVDAYYPLATHDDPTLAELTAAWAGPLDILANLSARFDRPITLTEIGYRSQCNAPTQPWDSFCVDEIDLPEQALAYEAAMRNLAGQPWLAGMFWWYWSPDRYDGGPCDRGYPPRAKPAEDVLRTWYGGSPAVRAPLQGADYAHTLDVYRDGLATGWQDWSWGANEAVLTGAQAFAGSRSLAVTLSPWGALSFQHAGVDVAGYQWLEFYVRPLGPDDVHLSTWVVTSAGSQSERARVDYCAYVDGGQIAGSAWKRVRIPLADLGSPAGALARLNLQDRSGEGAAFALDDMRLVGGRAWQIAVPWYAIPGAK